MPRGTSARAWALACATCLAESSAEQRAVPGTSQAVRSDGPPPVPSLAATAPFGARWRFASPGTLRSVTVGRQRGRWRARRAWLSPLRSRGRCLAHGSAQGAGWCVPRRRRRDLPSVCARRRFASPGTSRDVTARRQRGRGGWRARRAWLSPLRSRGRCLAQGSGQGAGWCVPRGRRRDLPSVRARWRFASPGTSRSDIAGRQRGRGGWRARRAWLSALRSRGRCLAHGSGQGARWCVPRGRRRDLPSVRARWRFASPGTSRSVTVGRQRGRARRAWLSALRSRGRCLAHGSGQGAGWCAPRRRRGDLLSVRARWRFASPGTSRSVTVGRQRGRGRARRAWLSALRSRGRCLAHGSGQGARWCVPRGRRRDLPSVCARWRFASPGTSRSVTVGRQRGRGRGGWRARRAWLSALRSRGRCLAHGSGQGAGWCAPRRRRGDLPSVCARWRFASPGTSRIRARCASYEPHVRNGRNYVNASLRTPRRPPTRSR